MMMLVLRSRFLLARSCLLSILLVPGLALACQGSLDIRIEHSGLYSLAQADILAHQPELANCASADLSLTNKGVEVPIRVVDGNDGQFGPGDHIEWIGQQLHGPMSWFNNYSITNTYVLSASSGAHARMRDQLPDSERGSASLVRSLHLEQENMMIRLDQNQQKPGEEPDVWHWVKLTQADPAPFSTEFDLPELDKRAANVAVRMNFRGISNLIVPYAERDNRPDDHLVEVRVNGQLIQQISWSGRDEFAQSLSIPTRMLKEASNQLVLSIPKRTLRWDKTRTAVDVVMFNWIEIDYPIDHRLEAGSLPFQTADDSKQSFEMNWLGTGDAPALYGDDGVRRVPATSSANRPHYASAHAGVTLYPATTFASPQSLRATSNVNWRSPAQGYDYLIVSHASLIDAVRPLAEFHEKRGMKVAVIDIADVYDEFNHGITHPQAVRNLVANALENWPQPHPRFLLLVGDASFDIRHETYNDLAYAKFANNPQELVPGHFSGIPATSYDSDAKRMGNRNLIPTWQYPSAEGQSASDNWFAAVDGDDYHPVIAVGRFPVVEPAEVSAIVNKTINYMSQPRPGSWRRDVMFITDESSYFKKASDQIAGTIRKQGFLADKIYASPEEADNLAHQSAIKDGLNSGQLLVHFIGHGGRYIWRTGPPDLRKNHDLFTLDDVSELDNGDHLPMILSMTCYSAPFDNPTEDSIGERFLREADKGAIAVFAASWRNAPSTMFSENLVKELLVPGATIGEAIVRAKKSIDDRTLVEMYNLLGDPAVVLERPRDKARAQLSADRWNPTLLIALPQRDFSGNVDLSWLDDDGNPLDTMTLHANSSTFGIPIPRFADGKIAKFVSIYASDPISGRDAFGGLKLDVKQAKSEGAFGWANWSRPGKRPAPEAADTLSRNGFEAPANSGADEKKH
ncbi:MAG TPA: C25 family cysteine peptidase [Dokdonella sp.]|uniref:C25 family cysteine peptidase n=1 Tax=Dokdonella sp. TaxID=2291710 RepID=UPI002D80DC7E|nr:C25 family cysteine peptidase [Dokdonella sp.]HET9031635.1 C25 family cysteine peptidase [Dokdonella sp.]